MLSGADTLARAKGGVLEPLPDGVTIPAARLSAGVLPGCLWYDGHGAGQQEPAVLVMSVCGWLASGSKGPRSHR